MSNGLKDLTFSNPVVNMINQHLINHIIDRFLNIEYCNEKLFSDLQKAKEKKNRIPPDMRKEIFEHVEEQIGLYKKNVKNCKKEISLYLCELKKIKTKESNHIFNAYSWYDLEFDKLSENIEKTINLKENF